MKERKTVREETKRTHQEKYPTERRRTIDIVNIYITTKRKNERKQTHRENTFIPSLLWHV
jgi:hypothetical protein